MPEIRVSLRPSISPTAIFGSGTPVALLTYGTVREARGFTSSTYTLPFWIAYCTFISPITFSAFASRTV